MNKLGWYEGATNEIKDDLNGFFKFRFSENNGDIREYNVWWQGLTPDVRIIRHNMPEEISNRFQNAIQSTASAESQKAYKEAMSSYVERT